MIARDMQRLGDWITPHINGVRYFDKPPLFYWLMSAAFAVFGPGEAAARLGSALPAVGVAVVTAWIGTRLGGPRVGLVAGLVVAANLELCLFARLVKPDLLFVLCLVLAIAGFVAAYVGRQAGRAVGDGRPGAAAHRARRGGGRRRPCVAGVDPAAGQRAGRRRRDDAQCRQRGRRDGIPRSAPGGDAAPLGGNHPGPGRARRRGGAGGAPPGDRPGRDPRCHARFSPRQRRGLRALRSEPVFARPGPGRGPAVNARRHPRPRGRAGEHRLLAPGPRSARQGRERGSSPTSPSGPPSPRPATPSGARTGSRQRGWRTGASSWSPPCGRTRA